jgi:hypothetical protein
MEYAATIWNPYLKGDIDKLEKIHNRVICFIKRDYRSRERGCITKMRKELVVLETLEERRQSLRLILMYKVVEGLVLVYQARTSDRQIVRTDIIA